MVAGKHGGEGCLPCGGQEANREKESRGSGPNILCKGAPTPWSNFLPLVSTSERFYHLPTMPQAGG